jgi:uncharacterized protein involved in exopolysaccharide biosynthesis
MKRMFWRARSVMTEQVENEPPLDIETKRPRVWRKVILTCALSGALGGFLISYIFPPRYSSQSMILVQGQKIPTSYVQPLIPGDFTQHLATLQQQMLSESRLRPVIQSLGLVKPGEEGRVIEDIRDNMTVTPVITSVSTAVSSHNAEQVAPSSANEQLPGFYIGYTNSDPNRAQKICSALTSLMVDENLRFRADAARVAVSFLQRQVEEARRAVGEQDAKLGAFKKQYMGQLPSDADKSNRKPTSPDIEQQYKELTRDDDLALAFYKELLAKKNAATLGLNMEREGLAEEMVILTPASLPELPDFPDRPSLALGGLVAGLLLALARLLWPGAKKPIDDETEQLS